MAAEAYATAVSWEFDWAGDIPDGLTHSFGSWCKLLTAVRWACLSGRTARASYLTVLSQRPEGDSHNTPSTASWQPDRATRPAWIQGEGNRLLLLAEGKAACTCRLAARFADGLPEAATTSVLELVQAAQSTSLQKLPTVSKVFLPSHPSPLNWDTLAGTLPELL
jgi:hypothetical protein